MTEHLHEWRFAPNIEKVSAAKTNTYGFFCVASEECQEYILPTEAERRLNATDKLSAEDAIALDDYADHPDPAIKGNGYAYAAALEDVPQ